MPILSPPESHGRMSGAILAPLPFTGHRTGIDRFTTGTETPQFWRPRVIDDANRYVVTVGTR